LENSELKKIKLLGVPVSNCDTEGALRALKIFLVDGIQHQVVFLDRKGLFKARHDAEYRRCLQQASLVLPVTGQLVKSAKLLKLDRIYRFYPFEFIIRLLSLTESLNLSVYLLGARKGELERAEKNLRDSFPGLSVVGRFSGYYSKSMEKDIILTIKKTSPAFLLVGSGIPGQDLWILRHKKELNNGFFLWANDCFDIFSGKLNHPPKWLIKSGFESLFGLYKRPWRLLLIFPYLYYWFLSLVYKIFKL
jgi:N-acetylglucosaminyldiphosphoundecaprenol N-acetyl-beta-D-mannosaminyltransferase